MKDKIKFDLQKRRSLKQVIESSPSIEWLVRELEATINSRFYSVGNLILDDDEIDELVEWEAAKAAYKKLYHQLETMPVL